MQIAKTTLTTNHGLAPNEVMLYRFLRLCFAPKYTASMNGKSCRDIFKGTENWQALLGLQAKGYVKITGTNNLTLEILK